MLLKAEHLSPAAPTMSRREKDENYDDVVVMLNDHWRVIRCKDRIQWIVQKASPSEWKSKSFTRFREGLYSAVRWFKIDASPESLAHLASLPERVDLPKVVS